MATCDECGTQFERPPTGPQPRFCSARHRWRWHHREARRRARQAAAQALEQARREAPQSVQVPDGIDPQAGWPRRGQRAAGTTRPRFAKTTVQAGGDWQAQPRSGR